MVLLAEGSEVWAGDTHPAVNPNFRAYYELQEVCGLDLWAATEARLCTPLPLSVRVNSANPLAQHTRADLERLFQVPPADCERDTAAPYARDREGTRTSFQSGSLRVP